MLGEDVRRAQSSGEWPGVKRTFLRGLVGMELCVGGGAREEDMLEGARFGRGDRMGGGVVRAGEGWRAGRRGGPGGPPDARWAELRAGKDGGGGKSSTVKLGTVIARVVVGGEGCFSRGFFMGGGGGGIAFRSSSSWIVNEGTIDPAGFSSSWSMSTEISFGSVDLSWLVIVAGASPCFFPTE